MPQVYSLQQFEKLQPTNLINWNDLVQDNWNSHIHWDASHPSNPLASLAAQQRLFYPRSFTISSSLTALNNPWFIDYGHLMFWFFFLSTFILVMWLVTLHGLTARNVEARFPRRETRGFSRAQTGDVMTAVLPLTWSITMLMHASTHSINFDENTAATSFSFTVIAYQWGWNYYFPRDILEKLTKGPRLVGRGHIDMSGADASYSALLERSRNEYMARLTLRGAFADRSGREVAANFLTLFTRAGGASAAYAPSSLLTAVWNASTPLEAERFGWRAAAYASMLNKTSRLSFVETHSDLLRQPLAWAAAAIGESRLSAHSLAAPASDLVSLRTPADYRLARSVASPKLRPVALAPRPYFAIQSKAAVLNTARAPHTTALIGNRLALIHKFMTTAAALPAHLTWKPRAAFFIAQRRRADAAFGPMHTMLPSWVPTQGRGVQELPLRSANILPNLWRVKSGRATLSPSPFSRATAQVQIAPFASNKLAQSRLYSGAPYSLSYRGSSLSTLDDLGPNNAAATKEINRRLGAYSAAAVIKLLSEAPQIKPHGLHFANYTSVASRQLLAAATGPANFMPQGSALSLTAGALLVSLPQAPEVAASAQLWALASLALNGPRPALTPLLAASYALPSTRLSVGLAPNSGAQGFFTKLRPFALGGHTAFFTLQPWRPSFDRPLVSAPTKTQAGLPPVWNSAAASALICAPGRLATVGPLGLCPKTPASVFTPAPNAVFQAKGGLVSLSRQGAPAAVSSRKLKLLPLLDLSALPAAPSKKGKLVMSKQKARAPIFYSPWLEGPTLAKPVRSTGDKSNDPVNFTGKSDIGGGQPFLANTAFFNWHWSWSGSTSAFALPLNKLYRGALAQRGAGGFWGGPLASSPVASSVIFPEALLAVSKNADIALIGGLKYVKRSPQFGQLSSATLDSDWLALAQTPACLTPEPFEDVDQAFVHQKWSLDLNTTRRSDHTSKYKMTWGPWANYKKNPRPLSYTSPQAFAGVVGSSSALGLSAKQALRLSLYSESTLPLKTSSGLSLVTPTALSGRYFLNPHIGAILYDSLAPRSTLVTTTNDWAQSLRTRKALTSPALHARLAPQTSMGWAALWNFKLNVSDTLATLSKTHSSAYPTYWADRALLVLTTREKHKAALAGAGGTAGVAEHALGAQHPLLRDILFLYGNPQNHNKLFSLSRASWLAGAGNSGWAARLQAVAASAVDAAVDAHLIARAQYSLVRDEIGSIRRLRVTKGIYLPSDVPMHVVCGSKDVIHSWALPGLNIKIDCIPGFNSHRRLMLRWRGAYWGQCMEVCGRYHHWMPILIHVVHKDIFLGWCLSYLKLIDARAQATTRALALMASVDLVTLGSTLATLLRAQPSSPATLQGLSNYIVHADLEE